MGVVWKATDTTLGREVAISSWIEDEEPRAMSVVELRPRAYCDSSTADQFSIRRAPDFAGSSGGSSLIRKRWPPEATSIADPCPDLGLTVNSGCGLPKDAESPGATETAKIRPPR